MQKVKSALKNHRIKIARISMFMIYFWFGFLKVINDSAATNLVRELLSATMPFVPFELFFVIFGVSEMIIGIMFLFPRLDKFTFPIFLAHMFSTTLSLILLPKVIWNGFLLPTLEGQYVIKNLVLISLGIFIFTEEK